MTKWMLIKTLLLCFVFSTYGVYAQLPEISFRQISPPGGFALKGIYSITQDDLGYIWMGTRQGLIQYDSQKTHWFIPSLNDSLSLPSDDVRNVYCGKNNTLWISTAMGLCVFDYKQQGFNRIRYTYEDGTKVADIVNAVTEIDDNKLLLIDDLYFGCLDVNTKQLNRIGKDIIVRPTSLYKDNYNRVWIGTASGEVFLFSPSTHEIKKVISNITLRVNSIYAENNNIWVGTDGEGAKLYGINGDLLKQISFNTTPNNKMINGVVRVIKKDTSGRLWFGTYEGLYMHDGKKLVQFNPNDTPGLPHNSIYEIFEDKQGGIWIGTWSGGVAIIHHSDNNFQTFRHSTSRNSISNNTVSSFLQLSKNEMLIGTEVGGLNKFDLKTEKFTLIRLSENNRIRNIKTLCKDKYGGVWIGTFKEGLWYKPPGAEEFKLFEVGPEDGLHISGPTVYALCAADSGVWIGTFGSGVNFYNFETKTIRYCFQKNTQVGSMSNLQIQSILVDSNSNLWIGTLNGLYKIHLPTEKITKIGEHTFFTEGNNTVFCLWEHSSGDIWVGTKNNGIITCNPKSDKIEAFESDGILDGKVVYGILEDQNKHIWISSNKGLIAHNPETNKNRLFVYTDGIQGNLFCPQSIYKDHSGNLFFGGTNGFTKINPADIKLNTKKPYTIINSITTKNNQTIFPSYTDDLQIEKIVLPPGENTLRFNFSADNYLMSEKNRYKCRLVNFYNDWIETQNEGSVLFKSLKAGNYIFEVKASNNDGIWNDVPTQLRLEIKNYWYRTNLALASYFLLFALFTYFVIRFYAERIKLKRAVLVEKQQRENEEQIHEMKLKFFTNISHEFRTPLTLISWPLKRLVIAENLTDEQREELEVVKRNSNRLLQLINQIMDLRKLEKGKSKLNITKINIIHFVQDIQKGFSSEAKLKEIKFVFESPFTFLEIEADEEMLDTIIFNLLSNAYKYVSTYGEIKISVNKQLTNSTTSYTNQLSFGEIHCDDFVEIAIEDTGSGIDSEDLLRIFNRFEQGKQSNKKEADKTKGSGIGLSICKDFTLLHHGKIMAQSRKGKGSRFTLLLPVKQKAQKILYESHQKLKNLNEIEPNTSMLKPHKETTKRKHILLVEDNPDFSAFILKFLNDYYHVDFANNGRDALHILKHRNIDLVVSDVMMPQMDGFEFCSMVKSQVETSHIPVILLTALSSTENLITGLDKGADAYLTKPFDEEVLLKQIENILEQRQRIHENFSKQFVSQKTVEVGSLDNFFLTRVRAVVEKNISEENFGMEKLSEELMISRSQLHRKIKSLSGVSTSEFVNLVRIKKAVELIKTNKYSFNEVAFQVGFSSQSYFNKCFKKVYGVAPKEYFT